jgi:hypothetical protein
MGWYNSSWLKRIKITTDNTLVSNANDVIYYDLSLLPSGFWSDVTSTGGDIRITKDDGETEVAREISGFDDSSETGSLFIKTDGNLSTSSDSDFYIYFDNSGAVEPASGDTYGRNAVWSAYNRVFHIDEPSGTTATNATGGTDATYSGVTLNQNDLLNKSGDFNAATPSYISMGNANGILGVTQFRISMWIKPHVVTGNAYMFTNYNGGSYAVSEIEWRLLDAANGGTADGSMLFGGRGSTSGTAQVKWTTNFAVNTAYKVSLNIDTTQTGNAKSRLYKDGSLVSVATGTANWVGNMGSIAQDLRIGTGVGAFGYYDGLIDETRLIVSATVSAQYEETEYNAESNPATFWTTGTVETEGAGVNTSAFFAFM